MLVRSKLKRVALPRERLNPESQSEKTATAAADRLNNRGAVQYAPGSGHPVFGRQSTTMLPSRGRMYRCKGIGEAAANGLRVRRPGSEVGCGPGNYALDVVLNR